MTETGLPPNVYRVAQRRFDAIPGAPWVYWVPNGIRHLFETLPSLEEVAKPKHGMSTGYNFRFLRCWWEAGKERIGFGCRDRMEAQASGKRWFPYMKGGGHRKWYGNQDWVLNYWNNGAEMAAGREDGSVSGHRHDNPDCYLLEGITYSYLTSAIFSARYLPHGFVFDVAGSSLFPGAVSQIEKILAVLNSVWARFVLGTINPTVNFQVGDLARMPIAMGQSALVQALTTEAIQQQVYRSSQDETTYDFIVPLRWDTGLDDLAAAQACLTDLERQINDEVYRLYDIRCEDRTAIEAELAGGALLEEGDEDESSSADEEEQQEPEAPMTQEELAVRWISYAVGVVLGRFRVGDEGPTTEDAGPASSILRRPSLGSAVYRRADFAVGSLPAPGEAEFDRLVGPAERFAYVDAEGGHHLFPAEIEAALRDLAVPDGITVFDEGHPRDLPALVERALALMLDGNVKREDVKREKSPHVSRFTHHAAEVIRIGAGGDLRKFLEKDFFTRWHLRWYRKRPVYWPLQSARRSYGFVLFHERVDKSILYVLQRDYLDHKLNGLRLGIGDLQGRLANLSGAARKQVQRQIDQATQLLDEIAQFAATMERVVRAGYQPEETWIDDGVILRLALLWELIPLWKSEPRKHWERLERGDFDWSHIAKRYWPERVREKCTTNKSYAIAHGLEERYQEGNGNSR